MHHKVTNKHTNMQTNTSQIQDIPALTALRNMEIGETCSFPIERMSYIRSLTSRFGLEWNKTFRTKTDRELRIIKVARTS